MFFHSINTQAQTISFLSLSDSTHQEFNCSTQNIDSLKIVECLQNYGYWQAELDSFHLETNPIQAFGHLKNRYRLRKISNISQFPKPLQQKIKFLETVQSINREILEFYTNKGYLFTDIKWTIDTIVDYAWEGQIQIQHRDLQFIDSLIVKSELILKQKKWNRILLPKPTLATTQLEAKTDAILKSLPFISLNKPSKILLTDKKNILFIFPKKKKVNYANGLLAFTNDKTNSNSGFTGNFTLHLENILKSAELFDIRWKAGNGNQDFKWANQFRYVYRNLGIENEFNIYKQDSTFTKTQLSLGLRIDSKPQSTWSVNYLYEQSAVDEPTLTRINYTKHLLNLSWLNSNLTSNYFDRKGHKIHLQGKIGNRITENETEAEYQLQAYLLKIHPLSNTLRLVGEFQHKQLIQNTTLENNAYTFGGFENMKGFIENRFLITRYSLFTPTLRFSQGNKYVAEFFYQHAFIKTIEEKNERLQSFGLQFILPVKSGWFNFGVSSGRIFPEAFQFNQALIHFGVKNNL